MSALSDHDIELAELVDPPLLAPGFGPAAGSGVKEPATILALLRVMVEATYAVIEEDAPNNLAHRANACVIACHVACTQRTTAVVQVEIHLVHTSRIGV